MPIATTTATDRAIAVTVGVRRDRIIASLLHQASPEPARAWHRGTRTYSNGKGTREGPHWDGGWRDGSAAPALPRQSSDSTSGVERAGSRPGRTHEGPGHVSADRRTVGGQAASSCCDYSQAARLPQKANKDFDLLVVPGGEHNAGRGGEFGPYGERKRFDFFVRQLLGVTPPSWNEAAPADRQPGSSELRTRSRLGHRARRAEPAQVGCGASKSLLNIRCSSIHRSLTCRRMKRNFPRSRRTSPPGGARLSR